MGRRAGAFSSFAQKDFQQKEATRAPQTDATTCVLTPVKDSRPAKVLSQEEAQAFLERLRRISSGHQFQQALDNLKSRGWGAFKKRQAVAKLLAMVWKSPLKKAGFGINARGFPEMLAAVGAHMAHGSISMVAQEIEKQVRFQPGDLFKKGASISRAAICVGVSANVEVTIKHTKQDEEVKVSVHPEATMRQIKEALAQKLGSSDIVAKGQIVKWIGSSLKESLDTERLLNRKVLYFTGTSLLSPQVNDLSTHSTSRAWRMNLGEAKEILKSFKTSLMGEDIQRTFDNLHEQGPTALAKGRKMLLATIWNPTMTMYEFPISEKGYSEMIAGIQSHGKNDYIRRTASEIEHLIRLEHGQYFGIPLETDAAIPEIPEMTPEKAIRTPDHTASGSVKHTNGTGIEITVRHSADYTQKVKVTVAASSTFLNVKEAFAEVTGRKEIYQGRLVRRENGAYTTCQDHMLIGSIREVLVDAELSSPFGPAQQNHAKKELSPTFKNKEEETSENKGEEQPMTTSEEKLAATEERNGPTKPAAVESILQQEVNGKLETEDAVEILLQHSVDSSAELRVTVPKTATFLQVKEAIAARTGRDDIMTRGRLVRKKGGVFASYKDRDLIGAVRQMLVLGSDLSVSGNGSPRREETQRPVQVAKQSAEFQSEAQPAAGVAGATTRLSEEEATKNSGKDMADQKAVESEMEQEGVAHVAHMMPADIAENANEGQKTIAELEVQVSKGSEEKAKEGIEVEERGGIKENERMHSSVEEQATRNAEESARPHEAVKAKEGIEVEERGGINEDERMHSSVEEQATKIAEESARPHEAVKEAAETERQDMQEREEEAAYLADESARNFVEQDAWRVNRESDEKKLEDRNSKPPLVNVNVKHSVRTNQEVNLMVPVTAKISDVKEALIIKSGSVGSNVRLATNVGQNFAFCDDAELLGTKRQLLVLGLDLSGVASAVPAPPNPPANDDDGVTPEGTNHVQVVVKNASDDTEIIVEVPATSVLGQVKDAVVKLLGRTDVIDAGTFVERDGENLTSLTDAELLGTRRSLLMLGTRLVPSERKGSDQPSRSERKNSDAQAIAAKGCEVHAIDPTIERPPSEETKNDKCKLNPIVRDAVKEPEKQGESQKYKIVHDRIAMRSTPSRKGTVIGMKRKDTVVEGSPHLIDKLSWLKLDTCDGETIQEDAWMLIDGVSIGLGKLLEPFKKNEKTAMPCQEQTLLSDTELRELRASLRPAIPDQGVSSEGTEALWVVIGGIANGGLLVRKGESLESKPYYTKLARGSTIQELETEGCRLHYRRIRGDGPDFGWINTTLHGRKLIQPLPQGER